MTLKDWKKDKKAEEYGSHFWSKGRDSYVKVVKKGYGKFKDKWVVEIVSGYQTLNEQRSEKPFKTKSEALKYAKEYMRKN